MSTNSILIPVWEANLIITNLQRNLRLNAMQDGRGRIFTQICSSLDLHVSSLTTSSHSRSAWPPWCNSFIYSIKLYLWSWMQHWKTPENSGQAIQVGSAMLSKLHPLGKDHSETHEQNSDNEQHRTRQSARKMVTRARLKIETIIW